MDIKVEWGVTVDEGSECFTLEELDCNSIKEWNSLQDYDQKERIQDALDSLPDRSAIIPLSWKHQ